MPPSPYIEKFKIKDICVPAKARGSPHDRGIVAIV
jgi:hypothetical protein